MGDVENGPSLLLDVESCDLIMVLLPIVASKDIKLVLVQRGGMVLLGGSGNLPTLSVFDHLPVLCFLDEWI